MTPDNLSAWALAAFTAFACVAAAVLVTVGVVVGIRQMWSKR